MNYEVIMFVVAFLCSGALVTVYVLWLAGVFSKRPIQQSVYTEMIKDAMILKKVEGWLEDEVLDYQEHADDIGDVDSFDDGILEGRHECADNLQNMINQWRSEIDVSVAKED